MLATQGAVVRLGPEGIRLNGEPVPNSRAAQRDSHGRPIAHHPWGTYRLGAGELWLFSDLHNAYDSRYFGPVHVEQVVAVLEPWWVRNNRYYASRHWRLSGSQVPIPDSLMRIGWRKAAACS